MRTSTIASMVTTPNNSAKFTPFNGSCALLVIQGNRSKIANGE
jgi:hypothetical protein